MLGILRHILAEQTKLCLTTLILQVINILGLSKETVGDVLEVFDSELLALVRLNSPNIVKVKLMLSK